MPSNFVPTLRTLVPAWGDAEGNDLQTLRMALALVAVLNPLYWVVYQVGGTGTFDPLWARLALVGAAFGVLGATFVDGPIRKWPGRTLAVVTYLLLFWYGYVLARNGLTPNYALGYYFVVLALAMGFALVWTRPGPLAGLLITASLVAAAAVAVVESGPSGGTTEISGESFLLVLLSSEVVAFLAFLGRLQAVRALERSRVRLREVEDLAGIGSWSYDLETGEKTWSEGTYRLFGVSTSEVSPPSVLDLCHPDDLDAVQQEFDRITRDRTGSLIRFRIVRPDGEVRTLRSTFVVSPNQQGDSRRLWGAFLDETERAAHEAELREARDRAEAAVESKTTFLANMSHEIRTPLTAIIGFAQLLGEEVGDEAADLVEPIETGGRRLLDTLNSVLDLARMEAGETDLCIAPVDLASEAREVARMLRPQAVDKGLTLVVDGPERGVGILADTAALSRVFINLLSNAIKFTERGGITVALRPKGDRVEVAVDDTGRGMSPAFLDELFEPFRQASTGWARSHEGTGLGLTITHQLVQAMDGTITVESQPGVGTRFLVSLPAAPLETSAPASAVSAPEPVAG